MPDKNGRLTTAEIVELIQEGEAVGVEFTHDHGGTMIWFGRYGITVDPGIKELVVDPNKADQIGQAFIAWAAIRKERLR